MRIGMIALGSRGDVQPYVALGKGLKQAGYEVVLLTHDPYKRLVLGEGLEFFAIGGNPRTIVDRVMNQARVGEKPNEFDFMRKVVPLIKPLRYEIVTRCWKGCQEVDALVLNALGIVVGIPMAQKRGIPAFPAYLQPMTPTREFPALSFPSVPDWMASVRPSYDLLSAEFLDWMRWQFYRSMGKVVHELLGTPVRSPITQMQEQQTPIFYGYSERFLPRPSDWPDYCHITGYWFLDTSAGWQPPADLQAFLQAGTPPVYIGFGSMGSGDPQRLTELVVKALELSGQRGILLTGWGALSQKRLPGNVIAIDEVPHDWLLPQTAVVVHHGGAGTTGAGLRAGLPNIIVPFISDQPFWGEQVYKRGVGPWPIHHKQLSAEALAEAITLAVTDQGMRVRAAALGRRIRAEDGVGNAVRLFLHYLH
jgi:sterol 3beta-glucosyltransferase